MSDSQARWIQLLKVMMRYGLAVSAVLVIAGVLMTGNAGAYVLSSGIGIAAAAVIVQLAGIFLGLMENVAPEQTRK